MFSIVISICFGLSIKRSNFASQRPHGTCFLTVWIIFVQCSFETSSTGDNRGSVEQPGAFSGQVVSVCVISFLVAASIVIMRRQADGADLPPKGKKSRMERRTFQCGYSRCCGSKQEDDMAREIRNYEVVIVPNACSKHYNAYICRWREKYPVWMQFCQKLEKDPELSNTFDVSVKLNDELDQIEANDPRWHETNVVTSAEAAESIAEHQAAADFQQEMKDQAERDFEKHKAEQTDAYLKAQALAHVSNGR